MKIRTGFVSNSSTSSFILLGYTIPKNNISQEELMNLVYLDEIPKGKVWNECDEDEKYDIMCELSESGICIVNYMEDGAPDDDTFVVGYRQLLDIEDEYEEEPILDIISKVEKIGKRLGRYDMKLITGVMMA